VTPSDRAAAQAALNDGRAVYGRLDQIRGPEDAAADIMELWAAGEAAMRAMLGGSSLAGQALVRELRQRGVLNLEQANSLASFWDARSRAEDVAYKPTLTDVGFARAGYNELGRIASDTSASASATGAAAANAAGVTSTFAPGGAAAGAPRPSATVPESAVAAATATPVGHAVSRGRPSRPMMIGLGVLALIVVVAAAAYFAFGRSHYDSEMTSAINLMTTGRTEAARAAFGTIAREYPDKAPPHVFLSRLARNDSPPDMNTSRQELVTAIRLDPTYEPAQREMGIFELADHNPSLARNFLVRAVQLAPNDSAAQGFLGCALMGLNRVDDAQKFLLRAGTGTWSSCATVVPGVAAPVTP
jgi:hypothetical protein